jgi:hypothetical protein
MSFTLTEKALIAIVSLFVSFQAGQLSDYRQQISTCSAPLPNTISAP